MKRARRLRLCCLAVALVLGGPAWAVSLDDAENLFIDGQFLAAVDIAVEVDTAAGLALAARASLAHAIFVDDPKARAVRIRRAEALARAALARDGDNVEALVQLAVAIGQRAREQGAVVAHFQGLADEGRGYIDRALARDPDNPWANAALGGWHLEIVRHGGALAGLYDATVQDGIRLFTRALALDPGNPTLHGEFAIALLALDPDGNRRRAVEYLRRALALETRIALDRLARARAGRILALVEDGDRAALVTEIRRVTGGTEAPANGLDERSSGH